MGTAVTSVAEQRLRENYPTVQMTILSLIIALVYENLVGEMRAQQNIWVWSEETLFVWSQCAFMLVGPAAFWFAYSLFTCTVRPGFLREDAFAPVGAALFFNVMVANLGTDHGGL
jgi:hypothetical protein